MEKLDIFKKVLFQIVGENSSLCNKLREATGGYPLEIEVNGTNGQESHFDSFNNRHIIIFGIGKLSHLYELCKNMSLCVKENIVMEVKSEYSDFGNRDIHDILTVYIDEIVPVIPCDILCQMDFLKDETLTQIDSLTIYALSFALYHEMGHVIYDKKLRGSSQMEKENKADEFAFEALKSMCNGNYEETDNVRLLGAFIGITHILLIHAPQEESADTEHPHTIERLYHLLDYLGVQENSNYWEIAYNVICKWGVKNKLDMSLWEKTTSKSYKDKFEDAYLHFRKCPNEHNNVK